MRMPQDVAPGERTTRKGFDAKIIKGDFVRGRSEPLYAEEATAQGASLPLLGRIAAGTPIEALQQEGNSITVPPQLLGRGEYYALEVEGDSMVDAGIHDGDTVVIERCDDAENGTIVVALVKGEEVTLKRLRKRHNSVALEPANRAFETRIFGPDQVAIRGKLVGLIRRYH
jgi:repressor LexA